jgi:hypothetical protein
MFERFTDRSRRVLVLAQEEARLLGHSFIGTEHVLLGFIHEGEGVAARAIESLGITLEAVREKVQKTTPAPGRAPSGSPPFTPRAKKVLELSLREALQLGHSYIGTEHMLLGLVREGEGVATQVLQSLGVELGAVRQRVIQLMSGYQAPTNTENRPTLHRGSGPFGPPSPTSLSATSIVVCSFCGLGPPESGQIVSGSDAFICEHCIRRWALELHHSDPAGSARVVTTGADLIRPIGPPPDDQDAARDHIAVAFAEMGALGEDGQTLTMVQGGEQLGPARAAAIARHGSLSSVAFTIDDVLFIDSEHAAVWFTISDGGTPLEGRHRGDAVVVDGTWKVSRATFLELIRLAGIELPPPID